MYTYTHIFMYLNIYSYVYIYIYIHIYKYTYINLATENLFADAIALEGEHMTAPLHALGPPLLFPLLVWCVVACFTEDVRTDPLIS